jgi:hypothetical protein
MAWAVGDTIVDGMPLLRVHGGTRPVAEDRLRGLVRLGHERTFEQDPKYAIRMLVDIAIRAPSPAINDPTTAVQALDQIGDLLARLGRADLAAGRVRDTPGSLRLVYPVPEWEDFPVLAFDEIRYCGASSIQVMRRMRALLYALMEHVPEERRPALERYPKRVDNGIRRTFDLRPRRWAAGRGGKANGAAGQVVAAEQDPQARALELLLQRVGAEGGVQGHRRLDEGGAVPRPGRRGRSAGGLEGEARAAHRHEDRVHDRAQAAA